MGQLSGQKLFLYLLGIVVFFATITLSKGGLYVNRHEGDLLHLTEIVLRMAGGQWPHLDFVTPLGIAAFLPISALVQAGFGIGMAILLAQILLALVLLLPIWWVAQSRFDGWLGLGYGASILVMVLALVHGETAPDVSMSMHYNRWAWALAFLAVPIAMIAPRSRMSWPDGVILGCAMAFFILGKATYAIALAPGLLVALSVRQAWGTMGVGALVTLICVAVPTALGGIAFWEAYIANLMEVSSSDIRPRAGVVWAELLISPRFLVGNALLLWAVLLLRKSQRPSDGLVMICLAPAFLYITYQNYGNDPKWLVLLAIVIAGLGDGRSYRTLALAAAVLVAPSFLNMAVSPLRHALLGEAQFVAMLEEGPHNDVLTPVHRVNRVQERSTVTFTDTQFLALNEFADKEPDLEFAGQTYPSCVQELGLLGIMRDVAADLRTAGLGDEARIFTADTFGAVWLFGGFEPLQGGAPWSYGGLSGFENAEYLLVPQCPMTPRAFKALIGQLKEQDDLELEELRRTELYTLYRKL